MTFYDWIIRLQNRDTPTGDLAQDIFHDTSFPETASLEEIEQYIRSRAKSEKVLDAFKTAKRSYLKYCKDHPE